MNSGGRPRGYVPDYSLKDAYREANLIDESGIEALCPSYIELADTESRYKDEALLGKGSLKSVFRTYDTVSKRWLAIARLRDDRGPEYYDQFVHEAWLTASLNHPNIINVYDVGVDQSGVPFFTMDLKGTSTLSDVAGLDKSLSSTDVVASRGHLLGVFAKICDAVAYAHSRKIIHLDLKPSNIQVDGFGEVLICDWGMAKSLEEIGLENDLPEELLGGDENIEGYDNMTLLGQVKGTPSYMAPEQASPNLKRDERTDVFALGCILYVILTAHRTIDGASAQELLDKAKMASIVPPRERFPDLQIPASLEAIVVKATQNDPSDRYAGVADLKRDLERHLTGYSTGAEKAGFLKEAVFFVRRNWLPVLISIISLIVMTVLSVLFVQRIDQQRLAAQEQELRAEQLGEKTELLQSRVAEQRKIAEIERLKIAADMAQWSKDVKNIGIYYRPVKTIQDAWRLAEKSLKMDPNCLSAHRQLGDLSCVQLNFQRAEQIFSSVEFVKIPTWSGHAVAFKHYNFTASNRPSQAQLVDFLAKTRGVEPITEGLMERIVAYDYELRADKREYGDVIKALVEYLNPQWESPVFVYDEDTRHLVLGGAGDSIYLTNVGGGVSGKSVLRFIPIKSLRLECRNGFKVYCLNGLNLNTLDIRGCKLTMDHPIWLPDLEQIYVLAGSVSHSDLRRYIRSVRRFEIIEYAPEK